MRVNTWGLLFFSEAVLQTLVYLNAPLNEISCVCSSFSSSCDSLLTWTSLCFCLVILTHIVPLSGVSLLQRMMNFLTLSYHNSMNGTFVWNPKRLSFMLYIHLNVMEHNSRSCLLKIKQEPSITFWRVETGATWVWSQVNPYPGDPPWSTHNSNPEQPAPNNKLVSTLLHIAYLIMPHTHTYSLIIILPHIAIFLSP